MLIKAHDVLFCETESVRSHLYHRRSAKKHSCTLVYHFGQVNSSFSASDYPMTITLTYIGRTTCILMNDFATEPVAEN